jgi:TRAP transporter 4TM/12TM fusion protein
VTNEASVMPERHRHLSGFWYWLIIFLVGSGVIKGIDYVFDWRFLGLTEIEQSHYFLLLAFFLSPTFLYFPPIKGLKAPWARTIFWLDVFLFLLCFGLCVFLSTKGFDIILEGWSEIAPPYAVPMAFILWALLLEALRRTMGPILTGVVLFFSLYPIFADHMPGILQGIGRSFPMTATFHIFGIDSAVGLMTKIFSDLVMGYIALGVTIVATGGGTFFLNLALSLLGTSRGGPAKVAVIASALFGSMSGSVIANVITTGSITIPAMKKSGYPPHYAGAVECCASTGGTLAPPVMGAVAFILASFIGISYVHVAVAAAVPTVLFYFGLFIQVDAFAARKGLHGQPRSDSPSLIRTLTDGWYYLPTIVVLVYYLFVLRIIGEAPWIAAGVLIALAQIRKNSRFAVKQFLHFFHQLGPGLTELCVVLAGTGMLVGSFAITGIAVSFAREAIILAGGNIASLLILGAITSLVLGMGMPVIACYVFLAIVLAPALVEVGLNQLAVHLFILYCGLWSFITPPVALASFPAGVISGSPSMKVALTACRLGGVIFILPFFFVLDPSLILQGDWGKVLHSIFTAFLAMFVMGSGFEGYMLGVGELWPRKISGYFYRAGLILAGALLMFPGSTTDVLGLAILLLIFLPIFLKLLQKRLLKKAPVGY